LVDVGFVEKSELDKRTNEYALTEAGVEAVLDGLEWRLERFVSNEERAEQIRAIVDTQALK
ncbi:MAG: PadR family transcriptional regulator, partial [Halodesulfurarchaeum sp.]